MRKHLVDREISIGDFVLTGGELSAMVVVDAVTRLIPGVLGNYDSASYDSFSTGFWSILTIHVLAATEAGRFPMYCCQVITGRSSHGEEENR